MPDSSTSTEAAAPPLVSVIVTCYKSGEPLREALRSAHGQTWPAREIIVVDDGSPPEHAAFIREVAESFPGTRVERTANAGPSAARNAGARIARGTHLAFLDHDDVWDPSFIEKVMAVFPSRPKAACVFCRIEHLTTDGRRTGRFSRPKMEGHSVEDLLLNDPACCGSSFIVRKDAYDQVGGMAADFWHSEAPEFFIRLILAGWELSGIEDVLVYYRTSPGGLNRAKGYLKTRERLVSEAIRKCPQLGRGHRIRFRLWLNDIKVRLRHWIHDRRK